MEKKEEKKRMNKEKEKKKEIIKKQFEELTKKNNKNIDIEKIKKLFPDDEKLHQHLENIKEEYDERKRKRIENFNKNRTLKRASTGKFSSKSNNDISNNLNSENLENENSNLKITNKKRTKSSKKIPIENNINNDDNNKNINNNSFILQDYPKISKKEKLTEVKVKFLVDNYKKKLMKDFLSFFEKEKKANKERDKEFNEIENEKEKKRLAKIFAMERAQSSDKIGQYNKMIDDKIMEYENLLNEKLQQQQKK